MSEELEFDFQSRPKDQAEKAHNIILGKGIEMAENIRCAIDGLNLKLDDHQGNLPNNQLNKSFIDDQRQLLITLVSIVNDVNEDDVEMFVVRAKEGEETIGFFNGILKPNQKEADIVDYVVRSDKQRIGVGKKMHEFMENLMREKGIKKLTTIMDDEKEAGRKLLASRGYKPEEENEDNVNFHLDL